MGNNLILGSGIIGYFLHLHFKYDVIGGNFFLPPLFHIHDTPRVRKFFSLYKIPYLVRDIKVGLWNGSELVSPHEVSQTMISNYKTKTLKSQGSRCLNGLKFDYKILEFDHSKISDSWYTRGKITKVTPINQKLEIKWVDSKGENQLTYRDKILSTIKLSDFIKITKVYDKKLSSWEYTSSHKGWKQISGKYLDYFSSYDYVYDLSPSPVNRYFMYQNQWLTEYTISDNTELRDEDYFKTMRNVQINKNLEISKITDKIECYGRLAQWSNNILVHNVIDRIMTHGV